MRHIYTSSRVWKLENAIWLRKRLWVNQHTVQAKGLPQNSILAKPERLHERCDLSRSVDGSWNALLPRTGLLLAFGKDWGWGSTRLARTRQGASRRDTRLALFLCAPALDYGLWTRFGAENDKHLADKFHVDCTPEQAQEHLRSLAELFLSVNRATKSLGTSNTEGTMQNETKAWLIPLKCWYHSKALPCWNR
jgi:hypothetical protein